MSLPTGLAACPLLAGFDPAALAAIGAAGKVRSARDRAFFLFQDAPAVRVYVLLTGQVKLTQVTATGQQVLVRLDGPGDLFGTVPALGDTVYAETAQALGPSTALGWESAVFSALVDQHPRLARNALRILAARVREGQDRYRELATERAEQRIAHALLRLAGQPGADAPTGAPVTLPLTRQDVAELAGTTLFTASRILRRWEMQGLITSGRARVLLLQPLALRQLADPAYAPSLR